MLRLKGKGLPKPSGHGDLLVTPRIVLPDGADGELEALMRRWRERGIAKPARLGVRLARRNRAERHRRA